ncbi:MAG TPA: hypothetical protein VIK59_10385 [Verrucomicrobiae bacterium]
MQEIESFFERSHKVIVLFTVEDILEEQLAGKLAGVVSSQRDHRK